MQKNLKITNFFILIAITISATLAIILGIQALTKSMKLNISFSANPVICCEIQIKGENETKFTTIFNNSATSPEIGEGVQLSGNTLTLNNDYCNSFGNSFFMKIQNLTSNSAIYITHSGGALSYSESTITNIPLSYEETSVEMKVSLIEALPLTLNMSILNEFSLAATSVGVDIDASNSNLIYLGEKYYVNPSEENIVVKLKNLDGYSDNISLSNLTINGQSCSNYSFDSSNNTLTISKEYATGNISLIGEAEEMTPNLVITYEGYGGRLSVYQTGGTIYEYMRISYGENLEFDDLTYVNQRPVFSDGCSYINHDPMNENYSYDSTSLELVEGTKVFIYTSAGYGSSMSIYYFTLLLTSTNLSEGDYQYIYSNGQIAGIFFTKSSNFVNITIQTTPGGMCFVAGTQVYTENGYKSIEDIQTGDMVWTLNELTYQFELKEVIAPSKKEIETTLVTITIGNEEITATHKHPFLTQNRGWVSIEELTYEDDLMALNSTFKINSKSSKSYIGYVYNLTVKDNHNYLVGLNNVVVHNVSEPQTWM